MNFLQLWRLDDLPTTPKPRFQLTAISNTGRLVATADRSKSTVTILNLHLHTSPRFIDTSVEIEALAITGNILLVAFSAGVVAWLVTGEGSADDGVDNRRADRGDSLWTVSSQSVQSLDFWVEGKIGVIKTDLTPPFIYHIETGAIVDSVREPQRSRLHSPFFTGLFDSEGYDNLRHNALSRHDNPSEDDWLIPHKKIPGAGWVVDPEGRRRFWVPVEWRESWDRKHWYHGITTMFSGTEGHHIIVKF
jgi:hypothetical protein